ncbi:MAG: undecaprenyl-diphosphatase [Burkholderiales bacterium]|nr:undecaprenyl-diphosphatase [Burkholderiales bacterium]
MEALNDSLFLALNAPAHPGALALAAAFFFGKWFVWVAPLLLAAQWLRGDAPARKTVLVATVAVVASSLVNLGIGAVWPHPRPFAIGLGHAFIAHAANASFPSNHLTLWWAIAFSLAAQRRSRRLGIALTLLGLPIAWARIYLGIHFPFDMLGAAAVAAFVVGLALRTARWYLEPAYALAMRLHRAVFAALIARGWVRE